MMSLDEYYLLMNLEEKERNKCKCCQNCNYYYTEYGYSYCKINDFPLEEESTEHCDKWK